MKPTPLLLLLAIFNIARADSEGRLFENRTEDSTDGWTHVTRSIAKSLMKRESEIQDLTGYYQSGEIPKEPSSRLVWKSIPIKLNGEKISYVRPTFDPYFAPFYGAHQFHHWLVSNGHVLYESSSDKFSILESSNDGAHDIEETRCTALKCFSTQLKFDFESGRYKVASCRAVSIADGKDISSCGLVAQ